MAATFLVEQPFNFNMGGLWCQKFFQAMHEMLNVAKKNYFIHQKNEVLKYILILVEEKKKSDSEFLSYNLMLNSAGQKK
jgi:hypothetical protein